MPSHFVKCLVFLQNAWRRVSHFAKCQHFVKCLGILQNDGFLTLPATYIGQRLMEQVVLVSDGHPPNKMMTFERCNLITSLLFIQYQSITSRSSRSFSKVDSFHATPWDDASLNINSIHFIWCKLLEWAKVIQISAIATFIQPAERPVHYIRNNSTMHIGRPAAFTCTIAGWR